MKKASGRPKHPSKKLLQVYVPNQTHARFKAFCALIQQDMSEVLIAYMETAAKALPPAKPKSK